MRIEISAFMPPIVEQLERQGLKLIEPSGELFDRLAKAIVLTRIHGVITESECDRAGNRLVKMLKVESMQP